MFVDDRRQRTCPQESNRNSESDTRRNSSSEPILYVLKKEMAKGTGASNKAVMSRRSHLTRKHWDLREVSFLCQRCETQLGSRT